MDFPDVRRAQEADEEAVGKLWMRLLDEQEDIDDRLGVAEDAFERWSNDFPMWLDDETTRIFVAETDDEIVGFAAARRWGPPPIYEESSEVYLDEIYVEPDWRRQGYGSQLVAAVRDWADRLGANRIRLSVLTSNADGRAFWAAQEALPMSMTFTIERPGREDDSNERSNKMGF